MFSKVAFLFATSVVVAQAGNLHHAGFPRSHSKTLVRNRLARAVQSKTYQLQDLYEGEGFFDGFDFFTGPDPTHGAVNYLGGDDAKSKNLAFVQDDGLAILAVDDYTPLPSGANRNSARISTKKKYNGGLFIADFEAMPYGCSTWPAYWSVGPSWPDAGEIDIVEGVNNQTTNQYTAHSGDGCTLDRNDTSLKAEATENMMGDKCTSKDGDNAGCAFSDSDPRSYGAGFNAAGGGVFAHLWDNDGIRIWHFARDDVPCDIEDRQPNPSTWPTAKAFFSSKQCDMPSHFHDHGLTLDTTLCGDWAGNAYASSGCPGTCAQAVMDPNNFKNAKWAVNYIAVYQ